MSEGFTDTTGDGFDNLKSGDYSNKFVINYTSLDCIENDKEPIFELLKPDEIFVLYKDSGAVVYIGNKDGKLFIEKSLWKDAVKSE